MIEADSVHSTPQTDSSSIQVIGAGAESVLAFPAQAFIGQRESETLTSESPKAVGGMVVKFPYNVCRSVHSRKQRRSKNGTPEERIAKAAGAVANEPPRRTRQVRVLTGEKWEEIIACFTPEQQQAFMADVWDLLNRHFRKL